MRDGGVKGDGAVSSLGDCKKGDLLGQNKNQRLPGSGTRECGAQESQGSYENQIIHH